MSKVYDVCVVGCGPAGISAAIESLAQGLSVLMQEKGEEHNMSIRKFYKEGKRVDRDYKGQVVELHGLIDFKDGNRESTLEFFTHLLDEAKTKGAEVLYKSDVESITPTIESSQDCVFDITTTDNRHFQARFVVVGIGKMGQPNKPSYPLPSTIRKQINFNANDAKSDEKILVVRIFFISYGSSPKLSRASSGCF